MSFIRTYFFVPEIRGKALEEMDSVFRDIARKEEARRKVIECDTMADGD